jgi:hypothetical protein
VDGLRNWAGMPRQVIRVRLSLTLPGRQERGLTDTALGGSKDLAETPIRVAGTEWNEWDRIKPNQGQSRLIKANQGKSSLRGGGGQCNNGK